jgi:acetyltransferase-like isoleucine patch superfamily enzyme
MGLERILIDGEYIILNCITNKIPCWKIRKGIYKLFGMRLGNSARIGINTVVSGARNIIIGERTIVNEHCNLDGRGGLVIGKDVSISANTMIFTTTHLIDSTIFEYVEGGIKIEDNVWLGANVIVLNDSIVSQKCILGAGSVFKGVSEPNSVYVGNPAKFLKRRNLQVDYMIDYNPYFR